MCRIKEFYYSVPVEQEVCTADPSSGQIHLKNYMARDPKCFKGIAKRSIQKPRKLVLSNVSALDWDISYIHTVKTCLKDLIHQDFEIYLWQKDKVLALTLDNLDILDDMDVRKLIGFEEPECIMDTAIRQQKKITQQNIFLLDYYWLDRAIANDLSPLPRSTVPLYTGVSAKQKQKLLTVYQSNTTKPKLKNIEFINYCDLDFLSSLLKITTNIDTINISYPLTEGTNWNSNRLITLLTETELSVLEKLELRFAGMKANDIKLILQKFPRVTYLNLSNSRTNDTEIDKNSFEQEEKLFFNTIKGCFADLQPYPALKTLDVSYTDLDATDFKNILKTFTGLEELRFKACNLLKFFSLQYKKQSNLKKLDLSNIQIDNYSICHIIEICPFLEEFTLTPKVKPPAANNSMQAQPSIYHVFSKLSCEHKHLKTLRLGSLTFSAQDFKKIFCIFTNLEEFNVIGCDKILWTELRSLPNPLKLKRLTLNNDSLDNEIFSLLLSKIPNIEVLDLSNHSKYHDRKNNNFCNNFLLAADLQLKHLKKLNLANTDISDENLIALLEKAPHLEELDASGCPKMTIAPFNIQSPKKNLHLKKLTFLQTGFNYPSLSILSKSYPNLESLDFHKFSGNEGKFEFPKLKKISCRKGNLLSILYASPLLEEIDVGFSVLITMYDKFLSGGCEDIPTFPNIKKINVPKDNKENYNSAQLSLFLQIFPNLDGKTRHQLQELGPENPALPAESKASKKVTTKEAPPATPTLPKPQLPNTKLTVDADTHWDKEKRHRVSKIFSPVNKAKHPHQVNDYRFQVFDKLSLSEKAVDPNSAFELSHQSEDLQLKECSAQRLYKKDEVLQKAKELQSKDSIYYADPQEFILDKNWQPIPSLSPEETMLFYHTEPSDAKIQIEYSERDNLHYIRSTDLDIPKLIYLDWAVQIPDILPLPKDVQERVNAFKEEYKPEDLQKTDNQLRTGKEYLNAITREKKGSCRHRSVAFMDEMQSKYPVRIDTNRCHMFAELRYKGRWLRCDLGGYTTHLDFEEKKPHKPEEKKQIIENPQTVAPAANVSLPVSVPPAAPVDPAHKARDVGITQARDVGITQARDVGITQVRNIGTEEQKPAEYKTLSDYCKTLIKPADPSIKKILVELDSEEAADAMVLHLQKTSLQHNRPIFYIDSAEDLTCLNDFVQRKGNKGLPKEGPGGPLYDFLTAQYSEDNPPIILFNAANFNEGEIVALNTVFGQGGRIDSIPIPKNAMLIAVSNTQSEFAYQEEDNSSRIDLSERPGEFLKTCPDFLPRCPIQEAKADKEDVTLINLYHSSDWKTLLLGNLVMTDEGLTYEDGALKKALAAKKPIVIQNGLWENKEFLFFWKQAFHLGQIIIDNQAYSLEGIEILKSKGYPWQDLKPHFQRLNTEENPKTELNPRTLPSFLGSYEYQEEKETLVLSQGIINNLGEKPSLDVLLTRELSEDQWAQLLQRCHDKNISLQVKLAPGVSLPKQLLPTDNIESSPLPFWQNEEKPPHTCMIESTDPDTTIAMLKKERKWINIDVSELQSSDLLIATLPKTGEADRKAFKFTQEKKALITALNDLNENIILSGEFSEDLSDALVPFLRSRLESSETPSGRLAIVTKNMDTLRYFQKRALQHPVKPEEKLSFLKTRPSTSLHEPLSILQAREQYPDGHLKLQQLSPNTQSLGDKKLLNSSQECKSFHEKRNQLIYHALFNQDKPSPCVFICGLSGVGKTTFVEKELRGPRELLFGEKNIEAWALEAGHIPTYLFIDEANLSPKQWTEMEGLFNNPPSIVINGNLCSLTENHKIIFAGNPGNHSDERYLAPFFKRHPCVLEFTPLSYAVVYEDILKPVFENTELAEQAKDISQYFLDTYEFLCQLSTTEILISPRELQMMALLTLSYYMEMKKANPYFKADISDISAIAQHYRYKIAKSLVPEENLALFEETFGKDIPPLQALPLPLDTINAKPDVFKATTSRMPALNHLHELLCLREARAQGVFQNEAQIRGGLGGVILEGPSSVGKTSMVYAVLEAYGFEEETDYSKEPSKKAKPYYRIDPGTSTAQKKAIIVKAVYEGAPLVMDEFNCANAPSLERLLNDAMMGKLPKEFQIPNKEIKPGHLFICMQNSKKMRGRKAESAAQARRLSTLQLAAYSREELLDIIQDKPYPPAIVQAFKDIIDNFLQKCERAKQKRLRSPTLRKELFPAVNKVKERYLQEHPLLEHKPSSPPPEPHPVDHEVSQAQNASTPAQLLREAFHSKQYDRIFQLFKSKALIRQALVENLIDAQSFQQDYVGNQQALVKEIAAMSLFYKQQGNHEKYKHAKLPLRILCSQAIHICIHAPINKDQQLHTLAKTNFKHRHLPARIVADFFLLLSCLFGLGFLIGCDRQANGKSFLFSREKTTREKAFDSCYTTSFN